ncbi:MAG: sulfotransferase [Phycisphaerales bacterium]|nr:sulfotransferase [Phycisphaerales bacterium]
MPGRLDIAWWLKRKRREAYQRSLMARGWYDPHARSEADAIFIGGCGRSGTTLFKQLLNRHSRLACGPETSLYGLPFNPANIGPYWDIPVRELERRARAHRNLITFADEFYEEFLRVEGKKRWRSSPPWAATVPPSPSSTRRSFRAGPWWAAAWKARVLPASWPFHCAETPTNGFCALTARPWTSWLARPTPPRPFAVAGYSSWPSSTPTSPPGPSATCARPARLPDGQCRL